MRCAAELTSSEEDRRKHERSEFMEAAKAQLLSGERRVYEFFLCKVGEDVNASHATRSVNSHQETEITTFPSEQS